MARVVLINPDHGVVENPILDANIADFYNIYCDVVANPVARHYGT